MKDLLIAARPTNGFRRCGVHHPPAEVRHRAGAFTKEEVLALKAEPNLIVIEADPETSDEAGEEGAGRVSRSGRGGGPKATGTGA
ncbi:HI1506-related protein [Azospirillum picis]|uniref:Mu-like prophage FluMu N-terminal domain-containing protein n=1 Tax=Azospirillum picis TaxID=488438 RepID=A0ABU0MNT5_9PROT|nr:HI1506-related protein [Azospirillum picis]MBP2301304.1 hypothetical protein [Azospirillum picis]MDQ0535135.1 hypothetical protein [Azospirillum picis]